MTLNQQSNLFDEPIPERARLVVEAYERAGTVWAAGAELGIPGQTVHKMLRALGYKLRNTTWDHTEIDALRTMAESMTITEIATQLGRPYNGTACKISELGIGARYSNRLQRKIPRGAGYDKASCARYIREIDRTGVKVRPYARRHGLTIDSLARAIERHYPDWWSAYKSSSDNDVVEQACAYCKADFVPSNGKQEFCTRRCADLARADRAYFGGKRRQNTIGLAEGICQLCLKQTTKLSSHHIYGKDNDSGNDHLVALCGGCHQIVGHLGGRVFLDEPEGWERLIYFAWARRNGARRPAGVYTLVEIEELTPDDFGDDDEAMA